MQKNKKPPCGRLLFYYLTTEKGSRKSTPCEYSFRTLNKQSVYNLTP